MPLLVWAYWRSVRRRGRRAQRVSPRKGSCRPRPHAAPRRRHIPFALFVAGIALVVFGARPTDRERGGAGARGHRDPRLRRLEQHARQGSEADADRGGEGRCPRLRGRGSRGTIKIGVVAFGDSAVTVLAAEQRQGGGARGDQPAVDQRRHIARPGPLHVAERDRWQAAEDRRVGARERRRHGEHRLLRLVGDRPALRRREHVAARPAHLAEVASTAGVHVHTIGVGTEQGTVVQINGFNVATALDADVLKKIANTTDGTYNQATDAACADGHLQVDRPRVQDA